MKIFTIDTILQNQIFFVLWVRGLFEKETPAFMAYELAKVAFQKYPDVQSIRNELVDTNRTFRNAGLGSRNLGKSLVEKVVGTTDENPLPPRRYIDPATQMDLLFQGIGQLAYNCMWDEPIQFYQELLSLRQLIYPSQLFWYDPASCFENEKTQIEQVARNEFEKQFSQTTLYCEALRKDNIHVKKLSTLIASFFSVINAAAPDEIDEETWASYYLIANRWKEGRPQKTQRFKDLFERAIDRHRLSDISDFHWFGFEALANCFWTNQKKELSYIRSELDRLAADLEWPIAQIPLIIQSFLCPDLGEESFPLQIPTFHWSEVVRKFQSFNEE